MRHTPGWVCLLLLGALAAPATAEDDAQALSRLRTQRAAAAAQADAHAVATVDVELGRVLTRLGSYAKALDHLDRARDVFLERGARAPLARAQLELAVLYRTLGEPTRAAALLGEALTVADALGEKSLRARGLRERGLVKALLGDLAGALEDLEQALALHESLGAKLDAAEDLLALGIVHGRRGAADRALACLARATAVGQALGGQGLVLRARLEHGAVLVAAGRHGEALPILERAVRLGRRVRARPHATRALALLARARAAAGQHERALASAREALRELEGLLGGLAAPQDASPRAPYTDLFDTGFAAALATKDLEAAFAFLEAGRAGSLPASMAGAAARRATLMPEGLRAAWHAAMAAVLRERSAYAAALAKRDRRQASAARRRMDAAYERLAQVAARMQRAAAAGAGLREPRVPTLRAVRAVLRADEALVVYALSPRLASALVLRTSGARFVALAEPGTIVRAGEGLTATVLEEEGDETHEPAIAAARRLLIDPLKLGADVKRVILVPDGALHLAPLEILVRRPVQRVPSASVLVILREARPEPGSEVLAVGDPDYSGVRRSPRLTRLPGTRAEAEAVGSVTLLGPQATEAAFVAALAKESRWRAVHLACHGLVDPRRPMLSSLALAPDAENDGFLTTLEIMRMHVPADLVVLSATGMAGGKLVRGEGVLGPAAAFLAAGARAVLAPLHCPDDLATAALMTRFHALWRPKQGRGLPATVALQRAQEAIAAQAKWRRPFYWAGWALIGDPD